MPRDGSRILSDLQSPTVSIVCEPCGRRESYDLAKLIDEHGAEAKRTDLLYAGRVDTGMPDKVLGDLPLRRMMRLRPDIRQRSDYRTPRQRPDLLIDELKPAIGWWYARRTQWQLHWLQGQVAASDWLLPSLWRAAVTP
jgi:hypothetical protein